MNNFVSRTLTGVVFVSAIVGSIFWSQYVFSLLFLVVTVGAMLEFYGLFKTSVDANIQVFPGIIGGALLYTLLSLVAFDVLPSKFLVVGLAIPLFIFIAELFRKKRDPFRNIAITLSGIIYVALPFALLNFFLNPHFVPQAFHPRVLIGFFLIIWVYDSFAYIFGVLLGRHRMFERISPKKSWEGAFGGFVFGMLIAWGLSMYVDVLDVWQWLFTALLIIVFGTFGDLVESMLKRSLNIKDSGNLLPGHGGLLDRFDAVLLAAPAVFIFFVLIN